MNKIACYFFDLDGTLIDIKDKVYQAHVNACLKNNQLPLQKETYWELKRNKINEEKIVNFSPDIFKKYNEFRIMNLEDEATLELDSVFPGVKGLLKKLNNQNNILFLITRRKHSDRLKKELKKLHLIKYFQYILTLFPKKNKENINGKMMIIQSKENIYKDYKEKIIIGDTEDEIECGKMLSFKTVSVTNGMRNLKILKGFNPDYLFDSVKDLIKIL